MSSDAVTTVSVEIAGTEISFETGQDGQAGLAAPSSSAQGDTMVLCTATVGNLRDVDFLPLTVDVEERMYAAGKIPGSFFKREGRSGEKGTLTARMIDRPIRPLFPKGWHFETQLVAMPLSVDHVHPYDILAMNGASAALMISDGPAADARRRGAHRQGRRQLRRQPRRGRPRSSNTDLDLVVAGTDEAILMVEAGANEIPEAEILDALDIAHDAIKKLCAAQRELAEKAGKAKMTVEAPQVDEELLEQIRGSARRAARRGHAGRGQARAPGRDQGRRGGRPRAVLRRPGGRRPTPSCRQKAQLAFDKLEKATIRERIAVHKKRPDGRSREGDPPDHDRGRPRCRAPTARRSSPAARRRRSASRRWAR